MNRRKGTDAGFSLVELLVATVLMLVVMTSVFQALHPVHGAFRTEPEASDLQQRLRVAVDALARDVSLAGAGLSQGHAGAGPLHRFLAPVLPYRNGRRSADPAATYKTDTITLIAVERGAAQTTLAQPLVARSDTVPVAVGPGCPAGDDNCGFRSGINVVVFDEGSYDTFTVTSADAAGLHLQHNMRDSSHTYAAGTAQIAAVSTRTYFLKSDSAANAFQLMRYDGAGAADAPVVDHVVGLGFEYFGDPRPPIMRRPLTYPVGPWTTYGPKPPPSGDNCVFAGNGSPTPDPRLAMLGVEPVLVRLPGSILTDGPWCPDGVSPNRFDADLLRIRRITVTLRIQSAAASLRGPAGPLFARAGTSSGAHAFVPDHEIRFDVAPPNLNGND